jgi:hypothetical protein
MTRRYPEKSKWAILIGTDYLPPSNDGSERAGVLNACVRDVEQMSVYLSQSLGFRMDHIHKLLSSCPDDQTQNTPSGGRSFWPTYKNVIRTFDLVLESSSPGDVVYIHFSGWSCHVPTVVSQVQDRRREDEAFALFNDTLDRKYLHDLELAVLLRRLAAKGLETAIFLDCRFLGNYYGPPERHQHSDFSQDELVSVYHGIWSPEGRDTWLRNPDPRFPHALLSSCYLHNRTGSDEYQETESQQYHGFLTYWVLKILEENGPNISYNSLVRKIGQKTETLRNSLAVPSGTWVRFAGNTDAMFLGGGDEPVISPPTSFPSSNLGGDGSELILNVDGGVANGVCNGAQFLFLPEKHDEVSSTSLESPYRQLFEVVKATGLSSCTRPLNWTEIPAHLGKQERPTPVSDGNSSSYVRETSSGGTLTEGRVSNIGTMESGEARLMNEQPYGFQSLSAEEQANIYRSRLHLKSKQTSFSDHIDVCVVGGYRYQNVDDPSTTRSPTFAQDGCLHLLSGDYATIFVLNRGDEPLSINVLGFDSAFGVTQVYPVTYYQTLSVGNQARLNNRLSFDLRLSLPLEHIHDTEMTRAMEVIKIFATNKPTSFHSFELRAIRDERFLRTHRDPAAAVPVTGCGMAFTSNGYHGFMNASDADLGVENRDDERDQESNEEKWCCFDARFVIHRTAESLTMI